MMIALAYAHDRIVTSDFPPISASGSRASRLKFICLKSSALCPDGNQHQIIEVTREVSSREKSVGGTKICGGAPCGFTDAEVSSNDGKERSFSMKKLFTSVALCVIFMSIEVVGDDKVNSLAILTVGPTFYRCGCFCHLIVFALGLWLGGHSMKSDVFFRKEILGALVSIQLIWLLAGILVYEAVLRLIQLA